MDHSERLIEVLGSHEAHDWAKDPSLPIFIFGFSLSKIVGPIKRRFSYLDVSAVKNKLGAILDAGLDIRYNWRRRFPHSTIPKR